MSQRPDPGPPPPPGERPLQQSSASDYFPAVSPSGAARAPTEREGFGAQAPSGHYGASPPSGRLPAQSGVGYPQSGLGASDPGPQRPSSGRLPAQSGVGYPQSGLGASGPRPQRPSSGRLPAQSGVAGTGPRPSERLRAPTGHPAGAGSQPRIGRYELRAELGRGAFATVYLARIQGLERNFALKLLGPDEDDVTARRFEREAQLMARLDHPGLVPVLDHGHDPLTRRRYLVMEHVPGRTLQERLKAEGSLPWEQALALVAELAEALASAHAQGVLHRDLKPANVLIDGRDGRARICDFGLARAGDLRSSLTQAGDLMGTPVYMAPEQVRGNEELTPQTDVYGLGMILYHVLCGVAPYAGATVAETFTLVAAGDAPRPSQHVPGIPREVDALVLQAIATDPAARPPSAQAFAAELRAALEQGSRQAPPPPWLLLASAAFAGLLAGILVFGSWALRAEQRSRDAERAQAAAEEASEEARAETARAQATAEREAAQLRARLDRARSAPPKNPRPQTEALAGSVYESPAALQAELERAFAAQIALAPAPRELLSAFLKGLPETPPTRPVRVRLLANLGREDEALRLCRSAPSEPLLSAYEVELLLRLGRGGPELQAALERLQALPEGSAERRYGELVVPALRGEIEFASTSELAAAEGQVYLWALAARASANRAMRAQDPAGLARAAEFWRCYLALDPGDSRGHYSLSECLYYGHALSRDPALIPQIQATLARARELNPLPVYWSFTGKSLVTLEKRPLAAIAELREGIRRADAAQDLGERLRASGWLVVAHLLLGQDKEARGAARDVTLPREIFRQLEEALPPERRARLRELIRVR